MFTTRQPSLMGQGMLFLFCALLALFVQGCGQSNSVVIYTSVDQDYSQPIITAFQEKNPKIEVKAIYDSELTKTTGLFNRIIQEQGNPQADVFWNSEIIRTIQLKRKGLLASYSSPSAQEIPGAYKDPEGYWTGFSARARVMIINTNLVPQTETPASIPSLSDKKYFKKTGMAMPQFGTTATHMAAMYTNMGRLPFRLMCTGIRFIKVLPGNATVKDQVARGELAYGLTDTDDFFAALDQGKPVRMAYLDQKGQGTLLIPNTVALLKGSPHPANGKKLIDFLVSPEVEAKLAQTRARQIPLRANVSRPENVPNLDSIHTMEVDFSLVAQNFEEYINEVRQFFP